MPYAAQPATEASAALGSVQRWARRRDAVIVVLGSIIIVGLVVWAASRVINAILIVVVAALLAYALMPAVAFLSRYLPRWLAILMVYVAVVSVLGALGYLVMSTALEQFSMLGAAASALLRPDASGATAPLIRRLEQLGISRDQVQAIGGQIIAQTQVLASGVVPLLESVFSTVLDLVLVIVLSIYITVDGQRSIQWLRTSAPVKMRPRVTFVLATFQRVIGGYIRGQLILSTLIGLLVGIGMAAFRLPYAVLLGVLAFVLEFIPIVGVFVSGAACVLIALTQGWLLALAVLGYFVLVHVIEGDVVGPRVVGKAVGVHPVVSMVALLAGAELFGIWGALFASPLAGLAQAALAEAWREWRELHANQFPEQFGAAVVPVTTAQAALASGLPPSPGGDRASEPPGERPEAVAPDRREPALT